MSKARSRFYPLIYPAWALVCVILFIALRDAPDPARPSGRMTPAEAKEAALAHLRAFDPERFGAYHAIDAAVHRDLRHDAKVWVVICDSTPRSALARAVVVDLDPNSGVVIRTRRPAGTPIEEFPLP